MRARLLLPSLLVVLCAKANGQDLPTPPKPAETPPTFRVTSNAIRLDVFVTDKRGNPAPGLTTTDFEVLRNGQPQEILTCSYVTISEAGVTSVSTPGREAAETASQIGQAATPGLDKRWISIVVNDLGMSFVDIARVREQLKKFVERQVGPHDVVSIMQVSGGSGVLLPFTSDKKVLAYLVDKIRFRLRAFGGCYT